ncbi:hypothetical protein M878_15430 [Streptomyces roseochromogenus subsp. oscitans DS 12.976]|uniref:Uncharacterized protein n=1 Tax=Streptomyces roseochromogenus subsp. oscitans DS 12.976 TaxID=1352936 RepID=V6KIZ1_STRRC|nr:hypothetical protein M878_15430 [Streptomyces roseochromogenus subsp. oscitans DS 12.976]
MGYAVSARERERLARAQAVLDIRTGGGEVLDFARGRAWRPGRCGSLSFGSCRAPEGAVA